MLVKILKVGVSAKGKDIPIGETVETDETSASSLIADGYAEKVPDAVAKNAPESPVSPSGTADDKTPVEDPATQSDAENGAADGENSATVPDPVAELAKVKKALADRYKRDDLYNKAKAAGVEIAFDAKKGEIVDAVIAQGKAEALLKA